MPEKIIAVIDGEESIVDLIRVNINDYFGGTVGAVGFTSPLKALEHLRKNKIDMVSSCIHMPDMDGVAFLNVCKLEFPDVPFIFLSALDYRKEFSDADAYIVKTPDLSEYLVALKKLLQD